MSRHILDVEVTGVEKRRYPGKHYVYVISVAWSDGSTVVIYRRYSRFFDLQSRLLDMFPLEAGVIEPAQRTLPILPGKILFGRSHIRDVAEKRLKPIDEYCKGLIKVAQRISQCDVVLDFFTVEPDDLDPPTNSKKSKKSSKAKKISKPRKLKQYRVVADYEKQETGEIRLEQGMVVEIVEKSETGWWFVHSEDEQGWVPSTYLEAVDGDTESSIIRASPGEEEQYVCIEPFEAENSDEVSLEVGAVVDVIEKNLEGWWLIRYQGQEGLAPATYLEQKKGVFSRSLAEKGRASGVEIIGTLSDISDLLNKDSKPDKEEGEGEGEWENETNMRMSYAIGPEGDTYTKVNHKSKSLERGGSLRPPPRQNSIVLPKESSPPPVSNAKPSSYVTVEDFTDTVGDGISFTAGQPVTVIEKGANDWWFIHIDGKEGWAPMSYIQASDTLTPAQQSSLRPLSEEPDTFSSSDSDSSSPPVRRSAAGLAAALQAKLKTQQKPSESIIKPTEKPPPPPTQNKKTLAVKPTLPKPFSSGSSSQNDSTSSRVSAGQKKFELASDDVDSSSGSGVSNLASVLKSKFESRQTQVIAPPKTSEGDGGNKKGALPAKPLMPKSNSTSAIKQDMENGVSVKPVFPAKPVIGTKEAGKKPVLPFNKPVLPGKPKPELANGKRPSAPPPNLPSHPPGLSKKPPKEEADSNNNDDTSKRVSGIAAAMKSKFENTELNKPKPKPNLPKLPSGGTSKPGKLNSTWNPKSANASRSSGLQSTEEELKSLRGSKPVGDLVSALSGKLNFGTDEQTRRHSAEFSQDTKSKFVTSGERHQAHLPSNKAETCVAIAAYTAQGDGELSMEEGEKFTALDKSDSGWWEVRRVSGEEGWVPASYLTDQDDRTSSQTNKDYRSSSSSTDRSAQEGVTTKMAEPTKSQATVKAQYRTTAMFTAENEGEIGFDEGEVVEVIEKMDEGWWLVQIGGSEGWAPADYIRKETINVPVPGGVRPAPPKNKPTFKPTLPTRPR
ncbi:SH3 and PX domain-containing protein 2B-like isoform X2 [Gigantopelta aegis]|uniref:SH3 and PX domain-containing protein 2B-like isoform X2 n=1 Tax=Gigantopelta aegis TaxID=1735272 RepID=UPI001B88BD40|nr:SH3 and PX domain-containing protein 2B-like isoform X2 [Gigantopelta aegis]